MKFKYEVFLAGGIFLVSVTIIPGDYKKQDVYHEHTYENPHSYMDPNPGYSQAVTPGGGTSGTSGYSGTNANGTSGTSVVK